MDFLRHGSGVQWLINLCAVVYNAAPGNLSRQGPDAPLAHRRPGYPSSGCVPAEPDSVSPGKKDFIREPDKSSTRIN